MPNGPFSSRSDIEVCKLFDPCEGELGSFFQTTTTTVGSKKANPLQIAGNDMLRELAVSPKLNYTAFKLISTQRPLIHEPLDAASREKVLALIWTISAEWSRF